VREAEHDLGEGFREVEDGLLQIFGDTRQSNGEKDGKDGDLQDLVFAGGFDNIVGEDVQQEIGPVKGSGFRRRLRRGACRYDQAFTGFGQVDGSDAEKESDGGDDFKIDKAFPADAADLAEVTVAGDAGDESAEDEPRDNQL